MFRQFRLYDVVTDIVPGVATVGLLVPLFPKESIVGGLFASGALTSGVTLLFAGYLLGRAVHVTSGVSPVRRILDFLDEVFVNHGLHQELAPDDVKRRVDSADETDDDSGGNREGWTTFQDLMQADATPETISQSACDALAERFALESNDGRYVATEEFGKSLLQGTESLHRRYEMMGLMFRSFAFVFLVFAVAYAGNSVAIWQGYESIWTSRIPGWYPHYLSAPLLALFAYPALHQWWLFRQRAAEAFANDLYVELVRGDVVEIADDLRITIDEVDVDRE